MNTVLKVCIVLLLLGLAALWASSCQKSSARVGVLEDSLVVLHNNHSDAVALAAAARARADSLDELVEEDEVERVLVIREITRDISRQLLDAASALDTLEYVLSEVYPDLQPTLRRLVNAYEGALSNKDRIIARQDSSILLITESRDGWRDAAGSTEERAIAAEEGWETEKDLTAELKKGDINIFGLHLDATCGALVGAGVGFSGPDAIVGAGCVIGI